jgi:hypothetical protein
MSTAWSLDSNVLWDRAQKESAAKAEQMFQDVNSDEVREWIFVDTQKRYVAMKYPGG